MQLKHVLLNPRDLSDDKEPPIKLYCVQIMYTDRDTKDINPTHGLTLTSCIMNPKARGEVTLKSSNPLDRPLINPNFFSNEDDLNLLMDSVKFARTVIDTNPLKEIVIKEVLPGTKIILIMNLEITAKEQLRQTGIQLGHVKWV